MAIINGTVGADTLTGGGGNDSITGFAGNDTISGGDGTDTVFGGSGNDTVDGGTGNDLIYGDSDVNNTWAYRVYDRDFTAVNNQAFTIESGTLRGTGQTTAFDVNALANTVRGTTGDPNDFGIILTSTFTATTAGVYRFATTSDDGSTVRLLDSGGNPLNFANQVGGTLTYMNNDFHQAATTRYGDVTLAAGQSYTIEVRFWENLAGNTLSATVTPPGGTATNLLGSPYVGAPPNANTGADSLLGGTGNDTIFGEAGNDTIVGGANNDQLYGGTGNDSLLGGADNDSLYGSDGLDTLIGGAGTDRLEGGAGQDTADYSASAAAVNINLATGIGAGAGSDALGDTLTGVDGLIGSAFNDTLIGYDGMGTLGDPTTNIFFGGAGNDFLDGAGGDDQLFGGNDNDTILGGQGNDSITGDAGNDSLSGGDGLDTILGGTGTDIMSGGVGADSMDGGGDNDTLTGDAGNDTLLGGDGSDTLDGGADNDTLDGGIGNDSLLGNAGADSIFGADGDDTISGDSNLLINGSFETGQIGTGSFTTVGSLAGWTAISGGQIELWNRLNGLAPTDGNQNLELDAGAGVDGLFQDVTTTSGEIYEFSLDAMVRPTTSVATNSIEVLWNGTIIATFSPGTDWQNYSFNVTGTGGSDRLTIREVSAENEGLGALIDNLQLISTGGLADTISGGNGNDTIYGNGGADIILGDAGNDRLLGGAGNDNLDGGIGADSLYGGTGNDSLSGGSGNDSLSGGTGADMLDGGDNNDTLTGDAGNDTLIGGLGADNLSGGTDNDSLSGDAGIDTLDGGDGDDILLGGADNDILIGGAGADTLSGGTENDSLSGGTGNDSLSGGTGADTLDGGDNNDTLTGDAGNDTLFGGAGADSLSGGTENDSLSGDAGADSLDGGDGADTLVGGTGNDTLIGGAGADLMQGGDDSDTFFVTAGDVVNGNENAGDADTLNLNVVGQGKALTNIIFDPGNPENGTVQFLDGAGAVIGSMTFTNIENVIPCFTPGTLINTGRGDVPVEHLVAGDTVLTRDNGYQPLCWVGRRDLTSADLAARSAVRPILICAGALGTNLPSQDMMVSPQHRMLFTGHRAEMLFGDAEVLIAALHLVGQPGISRANPPAISYIHIMCDHHEIIRANACWTESFQPGAMTLPSLQQDQRDELVLLFPDLAAATLHYPAARLSLKAHEARVLLAA